MIRGTIQKNQEINYKQLREQIDNFYKKMQETSYSDLTNRFNDIINDGNQLGISAKISKIIKNHLDFYIRDDQEKLLNLNETGKKIEEEIKFLEESIKQP